MRLHNFFTNIHVRKIALLHFVFANIVVSITSSLFVPFKVYLLLICTKNPQNIACAKYPSNLLIAMFLCNFMCNLSVNLGLRIMGLINMHY